MKNILKPVTLSLTLMFLAATNPVSAGAMFNTFSGYMGDMAGGGGQFDGGGNRDFSGDRFRHDGICGASHLWKYRPGLRRCWSHG